jgi:sulfatase maturation enzyme AslB (radical SAM superfamily)
MREIKVLHLEPTDVCQAACPLCARETDTTFDKTQQHHLDMVKITQVFDADQIAQLDKMFMCGTYGDPAAGQHTIDIYQQFRSINPTIVLGMNSNGALRNESWWHELGSIFNQPYDYVVFSIDGLEDTNSIYRKNVDWNKLMSNVQAFVAAGGSAHWDMLVYQHNEHQVDACEQLARDLGFTWFRAKVSKRPVIGNIQMPVGWKTPLVRSTNISCHILKEKSQYINARGQLYPCCWLDDNSYTTINFDQIQRSWITNNPHPTCIITCGSVADTTSFTNQWQKHIQLK